jgi:hypothetical protein
MRFWRAVKKGIEAARGASGPGYYACLGKKVECPLCGNDIFVQARVLLNTFRMTALDLAWADKNATTLACRACGHILWFMKEPERTGSAKNS